MSAKIRLYKTCALCLQFAIQVYGQERLLQSEEQSVHSLDESFDLYGDCVGFGPSYGYEGEYIQSDVQFSLQVQHDIRKHAKKQDQGIIPEDFYMDLNLRFFVRDQVGDNDMVASAISMDYGRRFQELMRLEDSLPPTSFAIIYGPDFDQPKVQPQAHGHVFEGMYAEPDTLSLKTNVIISYKFDQNGHFAGIEYADRATGYKYNNVPVNIEKLEEFDVEPEMVDHLEHTRLIGFRTAKRCHEAKQISQITPIYYSVNDDVCKNLLKMFTKEIKKEPASFGLECSDVLLKEIVKPAETKAVAQVQSGEEAGISENVKIVTFCIIWLSFFFSSALLVAQMKSCCDERKDRRAKKQADLVRQATEGAFAEVPDTARSESKTQLGVNSQAVRTETQTDTEESKDV